MNWNIFNFNVETHKGASVSQVIYKKHNQKSLNNLSKNSAVRYAYPQLDTVSII